MWIRRQAHMCLSTLSAGGEKSDLGMMSGFSIVSKRLWVRGEPEWDQIHLWVQNQKHRFCISVWRWRALHTLGSNLDPNHKPYYVCIVEFIVRKDFTGEENDTCYRLVHSGTWYEQKWDVASAFPTLQLCNEAPRNDLKSESLEARFKSVFMFTWMIQCSL